MIAIVLSACLISDPSVCRDHKIPLASGPSAARCMMTAPPHIAEWSEKHPQWRIVRWQCRTASLQDI